MQQLQCYKKDYPRPQFVRSNWMNLNGKWDFAFDRDNSGESKCFQGGFKTETQINVPFAYQCKASGIDEPEMCENIWYQRNFVIGELNGDRLLLHFEGCDYLTKVWVNGQYCGFDVGGYHRLTFDITDAVKKGDNTLVIKVNDSYSREQPRGKQRSETHDYGCWYIDTSGIYKTVWLEKVPKTHFISAKFTPNLKKHTLEMHLLLNKSLPNAVISAQAYWQGEEVAYTEIDVCDCDTYGLLNLGDKMHLWEVGKGGLYDLRLTLKVDGETVDTVSSYFGMREIAIDNGKILLNGKPLYQRLVLDQGYWEGYDLTAPDESALEKDLLDCMAMGFNGCRKHEKVEDERFLYYADLYGYIVWAEMPSVYAFTEQSRHALLTEWKQVVKQQYNHPCVLTWVPFNESWGVEQIKDNVAQQRFVNQVYIATKEIDSMRPVITNDGWEHTVSDILTIHDYIQDGEVIKERYQTVEKCIGHLPDNGRDAFIGGYSYRGQPIMITEFGGTSFVKDTTGEKWGYGEAVKTDDEYLLRLKGLVKSIVDNPLICGFCYTQVSNVYSEVNGLMEFDRTTKEPFDEYRKIFSQPNKD